MLITVAAAIAAAAYLAWGIIHHARRGDLHLKIVLEYLALAILGIVLVYTTVKSL
ncbi:MAG: hypothetical protein UW60_C0044G0014 [Candidatus Woesebacteria bacterium GW2011_GWA2_44_33]|uniref:Uncharacterized protein n=1 Tax=Candidatus Woesebacteria bacterium GW2011_GWA2_44_33 TaxID=1618564 RepID=A0A0G1J2J2_9BACT|nr:MAG: hypothetical protein UW60_C0044G0014 [Candidatus Woesebacteria bacterium GW2011_GWA2_44_33]